MTTPDPTARTYCDATNRAGGPCRRPAGWGTPHPGIGRCKLHGGSSPRAITAAAPAMAARVAAEFGLEVETTPGDALLEALRAATGHRRWLRITIGPNPDTADPETAALMSRYEQAIERQGRISEACLRVGLAAALVEAVRVEADGYVAFLARTLALQGVAFDESWVQAGARAVVELEAGG